MDNYLKRKIGSGEGSSSKKAKYEVCPHGEKCYRRNPHHFKEFDHPHLTKLLKQSEVVIPSAFPLEQSVYLEQLAVLKPLFMATQICDKPGPSQAKIETAKATPGTMLDKLNNAKPYNLFFTTIPKSPPTQTQKNAITFTDLLCPSLGKLQSSLQINFMIDIGWLMEQYQARNLQKKPMTILYGDDSFPGMVEYMNKFLPNVTHHFVKMKDPFGCHHSKIGMYLYEDGSLRVVVSTANLYYEDWNHYNQGLWVSPLCKKMNGDDGGESPTGFKQSLLDYLGQYELPCLKFWIDAVKSCDFGDVRVFLVTSVPGRHFPKDAGSHLHRVADLLSRHCSLPAKTSAQSEGPLAWGVIAQSSSLGSMGKSPAEWLRGALLRSLATHKQGQPTSNSNANLSIIFPTVDNVMNGHFGPESGGCLPYSKAINEKQKWLQTYLHQWRADRLHRSRAMPHIKSYCRVSPCLTKLAWYFITSANISKSAWGGNIQKNGSVYVRSYEAGVMFLPKFFDEEYFEIATTLNQKNEQQLPFMYDLPLTSYKSDDYPWCN